MDINEQIDQLVEIAKGHGNILEAHTKIFDNLTTIIQALGTRIIQLEQEMDEIKTLISAMGVVNK